MRLFLARFITAIIVMLGLVFLVSEVFVYDKTTEYSRALFFPAIFTFYIVKKQVLNFFFASFLFFYAIAETTFFYEHLTTNSYYVAVAAYILSYSSIFIFIISKMEKGVLLKRFKFHLIILFVFGTYVLIALDRMLKFNYDDMRSLDYILETTYNAILILVLSFSFLNYLYHDTKKALILFLACIFIVFSELVQVAYYFMVKQYGLNIIYSIFLIIGFTFMFLFINYKDITNSIAEEF